MKDKLILNNVVKSIKKNPNKSISFSRYMELVLYDELNGYYTNNKENIIGRNGDFFTSVSVGESFGIILSYKIKELYLSNQSEEFLIVEQGSNTGQLCIDIINSLIRLDQKFLRKIKYCIIESIKRNRDYIYERVIANLNKKITNIKEIFSIVDSKEKIRSKTGVYICNELLDAFPVNSFIFKNRTWFEKRVGVFDDTLVWVEVKASKDQINSIKESCWNYDNYPENFQIELSMNIKSWLENITKIFNKGNWIIFDYGYDVKERLLSNYLSGTIQCYKKHEKILNPLTYLGNMDISSHVNFTHIEKIVKKLNLHSKKVVSQQSFLINSSKKLLIEIERGKSDIDKVKFIRQFKTLTHPSIMGDKFKVLEIKK